MDIDNVRIVELISGILPRSLCVKGLRYGIIPFPGSPCPVSYCAITAKVESTGWRRLLGLKRSAMVLALPSIRCETKDWNDRPVFREQALLVTKGYDDVSDKIAKCLAEHGIMVKPIPTTYSNVHEMARLASRYEKRW